MELQSGVKIAANAGAQKYEYIVQQQQTCQPKIILKLEVESLAKLVQGSRDFRDLTNKMKYS